MLIDYHEAIRKMAEGHVVQFVNSEGTKGCKYCMHRGCVFEYVNGEYFMGMIYDPDYRYEVTDEMVQQSFWPGKENIKLWQDE